MQFRLYRSQLTDPAENLALEEHLFRSRSGDEAVVLIYQNTPCVVIGRNQNPWLECDVQWLTDNGIPLLRRISGGGAVWHDLGNLNISFVLPRKVYDPERFLDVVLAGLHTLGIPATRCERRSLWLGDRKIAGSAFSLTGKSAMIHACLLIDADLDRLRRSLKAPGWSLQGRFLPSVPAHVTDLASHQADLDVAGTEQALFRACGGDLPVANATPEPLSGLPDASLLDKYRSWQWTYGRTVEFEHHLGQSVLVVKHGAIRSTEPDTLTGSLVGCPYDRPSVLAAADQAGITPDSLPILGQIPSATIRPA